MTHRNLSLVRFIAMGVLVAAAPLGCAQEADGDEVAKSSGSGADELVAQVVYNAAVVKADTIEFPVSVVPEAVVKRIQEYQKNVAPKVISRTRRDVFGNQITEDVFDLQDLRAQEAAFEARGGQKVILRGDRQDSIKAGEEIDQDAVGNASGYLRRALSIVEVNGTYVVTTAPAALSEYFRELKLGQETIGEQQGELGVRRAPLNVPFNFTLLDKQNLPLFKKNGSINTSAGPVNGNLAVTLQRAKVDLGGSLDIGVDIGFFGLNEAHVKLNGNLKGSVDFKAEANGNFSTSTGKLKLLTRPAKFALPPIGPVPLTLKIDATANCNVGVTGQAVATAGGEVNANVAVGFQFRDGDLTNIGQAPSFSATLHAPTLTINAQANARCAVVPELEVLMFDAAGPSIGIEAFADARLAAGAAFGAQSNADASAQLKIGANFLVGGEIQAPLFDFQLLDFGTAKVLGLESKPKTFSLFF